jgi:hypothetical protein
MSTLIALRLVVLVLSLLRWGAPFLVLGFWKELSEKDLALCKFSGSNARARASPQEKEGRYSTIYGRATRKRIEVGKNDECQSFTNNKLF